MSPLILGEFFICIVAFVLITSQNILLFRLYFSLTYFLLLMFGKGSHS